MPKSGQPFANIWTAGTLPAVFQRRTRFVIDLQEKNDQSRARKEAVVPPKPLPHGRGSDRVVRFFLKITSPSPFLHPFSDLALHGRGLPDEKRLRKLINEDHPFPRMFGVGRIEPGLRFDVQLQNREQLFGRQVFRKRVLFLSKRMRLQRPGFQALGGNHGRDFDRPGIDGPIRQSGRIDRAEKLRNRVVDRPVFKMQHPLQFRKRRLILVQSTMIDHNMQPGEPFQRTEQFPERRQRIKMQRDRFFERFPSGLFRKKSGFGQSRFLRQFSRDSNLLQ